MKTTYLNPFNQSSINILKDFGNITRIEEDNPHINEIIKNTQNQDPHKINNIQELCYDKIRYYYQRQNTQEKNKYQYLLNQALEKEDIISTHALIQATAITYGSQTYESDIIINILKSLIERKIEKTPDYLLDETLNEYIDVHNTKLSDITDLINNQNIKLNQLLLSHERIIITYDDFIQTYSQHLQHRKAEKIYTTLCTQTKKDLTIALITKQIRIYMQKIESMLKQIEAAPIIKKIGKTIKQIQIQQQEKQITNNTIKKQGYNIYDDDKPTPYIPDAFPPCIKKALTGIESGGRNYTISLVLTPFLSYARLYPGVYARHIKKPKITDFDPTLEITQKEIIPLIHQAAKNCKPPLFNDQPHEKENIKQKLGFKEGKITSTTCGKTSWYTPINCQTIKEQQPELCTPCKDCTKIGNPLSYYNRKRKLQKKQRRCEE